MKDLEENAAVLLGNQKLAIRFLPVGDLKNLAHNVKRQASQSATHFDLTFPGISLTTKHLLDVSSYHGRKESMYSYKTRQELFAKLEQALAKAELKPALSDGEQAAFRKAICDILKSSCRLTVMLPCTIRSLYYQCQRLFVCAARQNKSTRKRVPRCIIAIATCWTHFTHFCVWRRSFCAICYANAGCAIRIQAASRTASVGLLIL